MRFFSRVLRASASAGVSSTLRNSTPFLPLRTLPSASAFSVRRADSRAAISPAVGLTGAAAVALADPPGGVDLPAILPCFGSGCCAGLATSFGATFGVFGPASFAFSRVRRIVLPFAAERPVPFACGRFRVRNAFFELSFPPRFLATGFRFGERVALVDRRAGRLAPCVAFPLGGALRLARAEDFLAGLDFVAMVFLIGAHPRHARLSRLSQDGGGLGKPQIITCACKAARHVPPVSRACTSLRWRARSASSGDKSTEDTPAGTPSPGRADRLWRTVQ